MSIYAISDLHLSFKENKPMNIFGDNWTNHDEKIKTNWIENIKQDDIVILPGDFSWAMHLKDTDLDFEYLNSLPGKKILLKGNHDFWWETVTKMKSFLEKLQISNIEFLNNTAILYENTIIIGTKGFDYTNQAEDDKLRKRELIRLKNSIDYAKENFDFNNCEKICAFHYPPITKNLVQANSTNEFIDLLTENGIKYCVYGHLHGASTQFAFNGTYKGIEFKLISCDFLNFKPIKLM